MPILPKEVDIYLGLTSQSLAEQQFGGVSPDTQSNAFVASIGHKLAKSSTDPNYPYSFKVLNSTDINAFALPGGSVSLLKGLLDILDNEDEVAAVLSHEIGHISERHGVSQMEKSYGNEVLLKAVEGMMKKKQGLSLDAGELDSLAKLERGIFELVSSGYSRDDEFEADAQGVRTLYRAGYNPMGMVSLLEKFQTLSGSNPTKWEVWLSTHPATTTRLKDVREEITKEFPQALTMGITGQAKPQAPFYEKPAFRTVVSALPFVSLGLILYMMVNRKRSKT